MESKGKPLIQAFTEEDLSVISQDHASPSRFAPNEPSKPLIEELDTASDVHGRGENSKHLVMEMPPDGTCDGTARPNANTAEPRESGLSAGSDSQSSLGPSWETLQKLAEQVGSTIEREPLDIAKEKKAFVKRMQDTNLGDLD